MAVVNVKAQGLLNGAAWLRQKYGDAGFDRVFAACSAPVQRSCREAAALDWVPQEELAEFLAVADRELGSGDGAIAEAMGAAAARANLRHLALRLAFFLGRPEFLMRRVAGVWRQYNEEGEMCVREFTGGRMLAELVGMANPDRFICSSVTGWLHEAGLAMGMKGLHAQHVACRAQDGTQCLWELRWEEARPPADLPP
jgi:hypothetical protein